MVNTFLLVYMKGCTLCFLIFMNEVSNLFIVVNFHWGPATSDHKTVASADP